MATLGHVEAFSPESDSITMYLERIDLFITANKVDKDMKLTGLAEFRWKNVSATLQDLLSPATPQSKLFKMN